MERIRKEAPKEKNSEKQARENEEARQQDEKVERAEKIQEELGKKATGIEKELEKAREEETDFLENLPPMSRPEDMERW